MNRNKLEVFKPTCIPTKLVEKLRDKLNAKNDSDAIRFGIVRFLSSPSYFKRMSDSAIHCLLSFEERANQKKYSFRVSPKLKDYINSFEDTQKKEFNEDMYNVITIMLANYLYFSEQESTKDNKPFKLFGLLGNKCGAPMQKAIKNIAETSQIKWTTSVEPCAGALGIHADITFANHKIINDYDQSKFNLYNVVKYYPEELYFRMLSLPLDKETFDEIKERRDSKYTTLNTSKVNIDAAVCFLYLNLTSFRNTGDTFRNISEPSYKKRLDVIFPIHERLKETDIYGLNIFDILKAHMNDTDTILIVDPPYLDTDVYTPNMTTSKKNAAEQKEDGSKQKKFGYNEHKKLAKLLYTITHKNSNDFIYFCRITAPRKQDMTDKEKLKLVADDKHMLGRIDDLYRNKGFYYQDINYDSKGTIERIITSFPFEGSTPYGTRTPSNAKGVK